MTQTTDTEQKPQVELVLLKDASAPKLSKRAAGSSLRYRLWTDANRSDVFWQIAANDGGQHSLELVPMAKVQAAITAQAGSEPFELVCYAARSPGSRRTTPGFWCARWSPKGCWLPATRRTIMLQTATGPTGNEPS